MAKKKPRYVLDQPFGGVYVRAWKERRDFVVQVWLDPAHREGEPDGDWEMPGVLGLGACVDQAILQTKMDKGVTT